MPMHFNRLVIKPDVFVKSKLNVLDMSRFSFVLFRLRFHQCLMVFKLQVYRLLTICITVPYG
jgi:hypothetical protein